jgi:hypothetical protein
MSDFLNVILIGSVIGLLLGFFVARKSVAQKPIHGGIPAQAFHYMGASAFVATAPTVLIGGAVMHFGLIRDLALAAVMLGMAFVLLVAYAAFDHPARA